jgi:hypothetical protein
MKPSTFWNPFDTVAASFDDASDLIRKITSGTDGRLFAWRGVGSAAWPLHSSLYRRLIWSRDIDDKAPTEDDLQKAEMQIISEARTWGLHSGDRGRLSMFEFLATLQHYGAPTRFIDVTFNPYTALFFATEDARLDSLPARVFAVEVTGRLLNGNDNRKLARWERADNLPWTLDSLLPDDPWGHASYVWRPAGFDRRIAAQQGGFLFGGVPTAKKGAWPKKPKSPTAKWTIDEVRRATSVPTRPHVIDATVGKKPSLGTALYSFRISAKAKTEIRDVLARTFGLTHATVYPDFPGFASWGGKWLPASPPG